MYLPQSHKEYPTIDAGKVHHLACFALFTSVWKQDRPEHDIHKNDIRRGNHKQKPRGLGVTVEEPAVMKECLVSRWSLRVTDDVEDEDTEEVDDKDGEGPHGVEAEGRVGVSRDAIYEDREAVREREEAKEKQGPRAHKEGLCEALGKHLSPSKHP